MIKPAMMKKVLAAAIGIAISLPTLATQFTANATRSVAMGGVGVASGRGVEAAFYNPALLSKQKTDEYELILPYFSVGVADDDNLIDEFDDFDDKVDALDEAIETFDNVADQIENSSVDESTAVSAVNGVSAALADINAELASFNNKALRVDPGIGAGFAMPGKNLGIAVYAYNETKIAGRFLYSGNDQDTINDYVSTLNALAEDIENGGGDVDLNDYTNIYDGEEFITPEFQSSIALVGLGISEVGVALSHEFQFGDHTVALGVTPKLVRVDSALINIIAVEEDEDGDLASGLDDFKDQYDDAKADETNANIDVGAAYQMGQWIFGGAVRNLVPVDYDLENDAIPDLV